VVPSLLLNTAQAKQMSQNSNQNPVTPSKDADDSSPKISPSKRGDKSKTGEGKQHGCNSE